VAETVVIVEDMPTLREGLAVILAQNGFEIAHPSDVEDWVKHHHPVAVIVGMHEPSRMEIIERFGADTQQLTIIAAVPLADTQYFRIALRSGAKAAFSWDAEPHEIAGTVRAAIDNRTVLPTSIAQEFAETSSKQDLPELLSLDEISWLQRLARGNSVSQLADAAGYSQREIFRRLATVYERMGARNRYEAIAIAGRWGLIAS
jgi:DNA-binding NarL/FixJ family response regulator